jgi:hypothetical protein
MKTGLKAFFTHFFVAVFFIIVALSYFSPVLQGKVLSQNDIKLFVGMAKEQNDFRKQNDGQEPYWTNSSFGGMPTYQLGAYYPHDYVKKLDTLIRFLPRPADYLFLYFIGFYILLCCMKVDFRLAILGALAFGFSTYLIIIFGAGHNAKAHALGYLPMVLGGIILVFRKKYLWGFVLTAVAMALEIRANHYQMTYYFMLLVLILGLVYLIDAIRKKYLKHFFTSVGLLLVAVMLGIAANATGLMATKEYADWSTRGPSKLTMKPDGSPKEKSTGLDKEYITQWSYGVSESLNLFVPRLYGGATFENLGENSRTYDFLIDQGLPKTRALDFTSQIQTYWGDQPITSGPAYIGAIVFFLFILGLILVRKKAKWWLLGGVLMSLFLSWGKNFSVLTDFMIDYFPLYNKFRAVSSIQVILELCAPVLAILALVAIFNPSIEKTKKMNALMIAFFSVVGICVLLIVFKGNFSFEGPRDRMLKSNYGDELYALIKLDRKAIYNNDLFRSFLFVLLSATALWFYLKDILKQNIVIIVLGALIVFDLVGVDLRYVNKDNFVSKRTMNQPYKEMALDKEIKSDTETFRVFDQSEGLSGARTSYFHQSLSGYHAAKPAGIQDLFDYQLMKGNMEILNMMNVKYVVQQDEEGRSYPATNPEANGNVWFISELKKVSSADEEMKLLQGLQSKREAIVNTTDFSNINRFAFRIDSTAKISLKTYQPNHLTYVSTNSNAGVAVFSEMYYANGWNAYIDGLPQDHFRVNYVLRALRVPEGEHTIEFKFEPEVIKQGSQITLASSILLSLVIIGGIGFTFWKSRKEEENLKS